MKKMNHEDKKKLGGASTSFFSSSKGHRVLGVGEGG